MSSDPKKEEAKPASPPPPADATKDDKEEEKSDDNKKAAASPKHADPSSPAPKSNNGASPTPSSPTSSSPTPSSPAPKGTVVVKYGCPWPLAGEDVVVKGYQYKTFAQPDFYNFRQMCEDMHKDWELKHNENNVYAWVREMKGQSVNLVRVFGILETTPPELAWNVLQDPLYRIQWDENRLEAFRVEKLNATTDIGYYAAKMKGPLDDREFLNQRGWASFGNGEYIIFNTSVPHPDLLKPRKKDRTRAQSKVSGYFIRKWGENGCSLTYLTQVDPEGWIPSSVVNAVATKFAPDVGKKLEAAAAKYPEWIAKEGDKHKDWGDCPETPWPVEQKNVLHDFHQKLVDEKEAKAKAKADKKAAKK